MEIPSLNLSQFSLAQTSTYSTIQITITRSISFEILGNILIYKITYSKRKKNISREIAFELENIKRFKVQNKMKKKNESSNFTLKDDKARTFHCIVIFPVKKATVFCKWTCKI